LAEMLGLGLKDVPQAVTQALGTIRADVWRGSPMPASGKNFFQSVFPYVMVERIKRDQFGKLAVALGSALDESTPTTKSDIARDDKTKMPAENSDIDDFMRFIDRNTIDNSSAFYLAGILTYLYMSGLYCSVRRI
jgi:hypothetical protein